MADLNFETANQAVTIVDDASGDKVGVTTAGELKVYQTPAEAPPGTDAVNRGVLDTVAASSIEDDLYTIPSGKDLTIQTFTGSNASPDPSSKGAIEYTLYEDPNGDLSVLNLIRAGHLEDGNFQFNINRMFTGDGTRRILMRVEELAGKSVRNSRFWSGFEA